MTAVYLVLAVLIIAVLVVCFWFLSKKTPKGALLAIAVTIWLVGRMIGSSPVRELKVIGGSLCTAGVIGFILGLIDVFRKRSQMKESNEIKDNDQI